MRPRKWQRVEGVVAAIENSLLTVPGSSVILNAAVRVRGTQKTRQVDVVVKIPTGDRELRIGVEVRDKRKALDVVQIEQLGAKLLTLELDRRCVVAGEFTRRAQEEAVRYSLELRTLNEMSMPEWWQAKEMVSIEERVEPVSCEFVYGPIEYDEHVLNGVLTADMQLVIPDMEPQVLTDAIGSQGVAAIQRPELANLDSFRLAIDMQSVPGGSFIRTPHGQAPIPQRILADFRVYRTSKAAPFTPYQMGSVTSAITSVLDNINKQVTFVSHDQPDGSRRMSLSVTDVAPKATVLRPPEK